MPKKQIVEENIEMQSIGHNRWIYKGLGGQFVQILFENRRDAEQTAQRLYDENRANSDLAGNKFVTDTRPPRINTTKAKFQRFFPAGKPFFRIHVSAYPAIQKAEAANLAYDPNNTQYLNLPVLPDLAHASTHAKQQEEKTTQTDSQEPTSDNTCTIT